MLVPFDLENEQIQQWGRTYNQNVIHATHPKGVGHSVSQFLASYLCLRLLI